MSIPYAASDRPWPSEAAGIQDFCKTAMLSSQQPSSCLDAPAFLVALDAGFSYREYRVASQGVTIGRDGSQCDIVVTGACVSRRHARVTSNAPGSFQLEDLGSTNGVFHNRRRVIGPTALQDGDLLSLGADHTNHLRFQTRSSLEPRQSILPPQEQWVIGRALDSDIPLSFEPTVSSRHAILRRHDRGLRLADLHSRNGTWVNGQCVREADLQPSDTVVIGSTHFRFELTSDGTLLIQQRECGQAVKLECVGLTRTAVNGRAETKTLLDNITLSFEPGEFIGILGPSGAGKTSLLTALNGFTRPSRGQVLYNEIPLDTASAMLRNTIGYVPQDDILHPELSVEDSLGYIARLRLSPDMDSVQRNSIVDGTIETLGLSQVRRTPLHQLSGGQRKRVSIGAELLVRPSILFLDEPTSGLDPSTEDRLMRHFRSMAHNGTTVVITTHVLYNLSLLDKVVILSQGQLVFFGTPEEALKYFSEKNASRIQPTGIFDLLTGIEGSTPAGSGDRTNDEQVMIASHFAHQYRHCQFYQDHIEARLSTAALKIRVNRQTSPDRTLTETPARPTPIGKRRLAASIAELGTLQAWRILSQRHLHIRCLAPKRLLLFFCIPVLLALVSLSQHMHGVLADEQIRAQKKPFLEAALLSGTAMDGQLRGLLTSAGNSDPRSAPELLYALRFEGVANLPVPMSVLLMIVMTAVFSGTFIACLEISTEQSIYRRERMSHLAILPYLGSKLPFCMTITALQCLLFLAICWCSPALPMAAFLPVWLVMVAIAWSSVAIGLFLSTVDPTAGRFSVLLAITVVLPQLILSGGLGPDFYARMSSGLQWAGNLLPARSGLTMICTAMFHPLTGEGVGWIPGLIREVIGFDFGRTVYYTGGCLLITQFLFWLFTSAWFLKRRDPR